MTKKGSGTNNDRRSLNGLPGCGDDELRKTRCFWDGGVETESLGSGACPFVFLLCGGWVFLDFVWSGAVAVLLACCLGDRGDEGMNAPCYWAPDAIVVTEGGKRKLK